MESGLEILDTSNPFEWLDFWADETPLRSAILSPEVAINFQELKRTVVLLSDKLGASGLGAGSRVMVSLPAGFDWIASLALFKLGAIPSYIESSLLGNARSDVFDFGIVLSEQVLNSPVDLIWIPLTPRDFEGEAQVVSRSGVATYFEDSPICILENSLGELIPISFGAALERLKDLPELATEPKRELSLFSLGVHWGFMHALKCLAAGAPLLALGHNTVEDTTHSLLEKFKPLIVEGSAISISKFLLYFEEQGLKYSNLESVRFINSSLSEVFFDYVKFQFGVNILSRYGSLEVGVLFNNEIRAKSELGDLGNLVPSGRLRLVNDSGFPVLPGDFGKAFALTDGAVGLQSEAQKLTPDQFGGYFPLGNKISRLDDRYWLGEIISPGLSVGGDLIPDELLEDFAVSQPLVRDAACFEGFGPKGEPVLAMAVAGKRGFDIQSFADRIRSEFPGIHPRFFTELTGIPKYGTGRPHRDALSRLFSENFLNGNRN